MRLRYTILILAAAGLAFLAVLSVGAYFYSMAKLKNGLTYFHSQIVQGHGNVESLEVQYDNLRLQLPFGLTADNVRLDIMTSGSDQHVQISVESISAQLKGFPTGQMKVSARNLNLTS